MIVDQLMRVVKAAAALCRCLHAQLTDKVLAGGGAVLTTPVGAINMRGAQLPARFALMLQHGLLASDPSLGHMH